MTDLNDGMRRRTYKKNQITVIFNPKKILSEMVKYIRASDFVVGCIAWFTNKKVLKALEKTKGVSFVVTRHKMADPNASSS